LVSGVLAVNVPAVDWWGSGSLMTRVLVVSADPLRLAGERFADGLYACQRGER
jgi:hypothetical protein